MSRNDAEILHVLQQIVAMNPQDSDAAAQLAELKKHIPEPPRPKAVVEKNHDMTQDLYRNLREARMSRNDAEILRVLQQIVATDPQDRDAAAQLAELKKRMPEQPRPKAAADKNYHLTKDLFRKLRHAIIEHDEYTAFRIVEEILAIDPQNKDAEMQKRDLGQRLAAQAARPLKQHLETGDLPAMIALVAELRTYATEDYLETLPDYSAAAYMVNAEHQKKARTGLQEAYNALMQVTGTEARELAAQALERQALENNLSFEPAQRAELEKIHAAWQEVLRIRNMQERLEEQQLAYDDCCKMLRQTKDYAAAIPALDKCIAELSPLTELPEAQALLDTIEKRRQRLQDILTSVNRGKAVKKMVSSSIIALGIGAVAVVGYAYCTANEMNTKLLALRQAKQAQQMQTTLYTQRYIIPIAVRLNSDYAATHKQSQAWLKDWHEAQASYENTLKELKLKVQDSAASDFSQLLTLISKVTALNELLSKEYSAPPTQAQLILQTDLISHVEERKDQELQQYLSIPTSTGLPELRALYAKYKILQRVFPQPEDVQQRVADSFLNVLLARWEDSSSAVAVEQHLREFDEISVEMDLPLDLRNILANRLGEFKNLAQLAHCHTLAEYVALIKEHPILLEFGNNPYSLDSLLQTADTYNRNGGDLVIRQHLQELYDKKRIGGVTKAALQGRIGTQDYLTALREIYFDNASVYMGQPQPASINAYVDAMTQTKKAAAWRKDYSLVEDSNKSKVWVGVAQPVKQVQGRYIVNALAEDGKKWVKIADVTSLTPPVRMSLHKMREQCGMKRIDLQCGLHTPAELMMKIVKLTDADGPVLARAYLFDLVVSMAENLPDAFVGGYGLSDSMRQDIKHFKELKNNRSLSEGCWLKALSIAETRKWQDFFNACRTHDYVREIRGTLDTLSAGRLDFAGYVNEKGVPKLIPSASSKLYIIRNGSLEPIEEKTTVPFTPLFNLK